MKKFGYLLLMLVVTTSLIGCRINQEEKLISVNTRNNVEHNPLELSIEQRVEDFQYLYETMNKLYPYWGEIKDLGKDKEALYNKYLEEVKKTDSTTAFCNTVLDYFNALDAYSLGHLSPIMPGAYDYLKALYEPSQNRQSWYKVLSNPVSSKLYSACNVNVTHQFQLLQEDEGEEGKSAKEKQQENHTQQDEATESMLGVMPLTLKVIEDGTIGYIKVPSFDGLMIEEQVPEIRAFIQAHQDLDHMIIDIRGNGGGSDTYWREAFASPNITEEKYVHSCYLYNEETIENELSKPFMEEIHPGLFKEKMGLEQLLEATSLNPNGNSFAYCTYNIQEIKPSSEEVDYKGKFWVLIDQYNASASASFIQFCKENQFATLVGEPDSGDNCNGDPFLFCLPNSGMIIRFDLFYGVNIDGSCNAISGCQPDIECLSQEALQICLENIRKNKEDDSTQNKPKKISIRWKNHEN